MGSSSINPDGRLSIRTDQSREAMIKAFDFWFPDPDAPDFRAAKITPASPELIQQWKRIGWMPESASGPFWRIEVPFPNSQAGDYYSVTIERPQAPTLDEAMWIVWGVYYDE